MKMKVRGLQLVLSTEPTPACPILDIAEQALNGGIDSIQFRHKGIFNKETFFLVCQLAELCFQHTTPFIINDRVDIALASHASGVHLGQSDLPLKCARKLLGHDKIIGATAGTLEEALRAQEEGADYIGIGHIFPTKTKIKTTPPLGLKTLGFIREAISTPILAIGGINDSNLQAVCQTGVNGVAVVSAICGHLDPLAQTKKLKAIMEEYGTQCC